MERRVLIYSHDSFGLGHLRRCREIAHTLVDSFPGLSVLILSGSPIIGSFDFKARVDFVRVPGVIKLRNGEYTSLNLHIDVDKILEIRASIMEHTASVYDPDVFIVDKEPLGLRGEVGPTLELLRQRGTHCVLGLRDVMDDPAALAPEWRRKNAMPALVSLYDAIWVYGLPQICNPLDGLDVPGPVQRKLSFTGYLPRSLPQASTPPHLEKINQPYILVTVGGGGDGEAIVDWVLRAYESDPGIPYPAVLVLGPFMGAEQQTEFFERAAALERVEALTFETHIESLIEGAVGIVGMGGYNTFCEILSFDKPALLVPRSKPRLEQTIRADRAAELGLVGVLPDDGERPAAAMATALKTLPQRGRPSSVVVPGLLDGRENIRRLMRPLLARRRETGDAGTRRLKAW